MTGQPDMLHYRVTVTGTVALPPGTDAATHITSLLSVLGLAGITVKVSPTATELTALGLRNDVVRRLLDREVTTVAELVAKDEDWLRTPGKGIGYASFRNIIRALHAHGHQLSGQPAYADSIESLEGSVALYEQLRAANIRLMTDLTALSKLQVLEFGIGGGYLKELVHVLHELGLELRPLDVADLSIADVMPHSIYWPGGPTLLEKLQPYGITSTSSVLALAPHSIEFLMAESRVELDPGWDRHLRAAQIALGLRLPETTD